MSSSRTPANHSGQSDRPGQSNRTSSATQKPSTSEDVDWPEEDLLGSSKKKLQPPGKNFRAGVKNEHCPTFDHDGPPYFQGGRVGHIGEGYRVGQPEGKVHGTLDRASNPSFGADSDKRARPLDTPHRQYIDNPNYISFHIQDLKVRLT